MSRSKLVSKQLREFYETSSEEKRLEGGLGTLEFSRNKTLISKYITNPNSIILDIGGGTGKYAKWLAKKGHLVHLIDPIEKHVNRASKRAAKLENPFTAELGEARNLPFEHNMADAVILHGPLYHLQKTEDRAKALLEAKRVLKPGGILLGFTINYTASTLVGLWQGLIHEAGFYKMCLEELTTGIHNPPADFPWLLADAYYHNPSVLKSEIDDCGFDFIDIHAVEGMAWIDSKYFENMANPERRDNLMNLIEQTENDQNLLAFSPHMMIAASKAH
jgi:SAM-dependent methyltransferase